MSSLQIGPQYYPPRPLGAQVISRGPHGMRFAKDPMPKPGGGFTWWNEQSLESDEYKTPWLPQQKVTGVLGLGGVMDLITAPYVWAYDKLRGASSPPAPRGQSAPAGTVAAQFVQAFNAFMTAQAANNRPIMVQQYGVLTAAWASLSPTERSNYSADYQRAGLLMGGDPQETASRQVTAQNRARVQAQVDADKRRGDPSMWDYVPGEVASRVGQATTAASHYALPALGTVVAAGAGILFLYAVGSGLGKGLAGRRTVSSNPRRRRRRRK